MVSVESSHVPLAVASGCWTFVGICYYQEVERKREKKKRFFWMKYHHDDRISHAPFIWWISEILSRLSFSLPFFRFWLWLNKWLNKSFPCLHTLFCRFHFHLTSATFQQVLFVCYFFFFFKQGPNAQLKRFNVKRKLQWCDRDNIRLILELVRSR